MGKYGLIIPSFGERLEHLMAAAGYDVTKRGMDRKLSKAMHAAGCLPVNEKLSIDMEDAKALLEKSIDNNRKVIGNHRKAAAPPSTEWIMAYCRFFRCSADYLLGYIDSPTHESVAVEQETGLSEASVSVLRRFSAAARAGDHSGENERKVLEVLDLLLGEDLDRDFPEWRFDSSGRLVGHGKSSWDFGLLILLHKYIAESDLRYLTGRTANERGKYSVIEAQDVTRGGTLDPIPIKDLYRRDLLDKIRDELNRLRTTYQE